MQAIPRIQHKTVRVMNYGLYLIFSFSFSFILFYFLGLMHDIMVTLGSSSLVVLITEGLVRALE